MARSIEAEYKKLPELVVAAQAESAALEEAMAEFDVKHDAKQAELAQELGCSRATLAAAEADVRGLEGACEAIEAILQES